MAMADNPASSPVAGHNGVVEKASDNLHGERELGQHHDLDADDSYARPTKHSPAAGGATRPFCGIPFWGKLSRRSKMVLAGTSLVLLVGLGVGLGVGLTVGRKDQDGSSPTTSATAAPSALWQPEVGASWQIILDGELQIDEASPSVTPDVDVFDIDMFVHSKNQAIPALHKLGKKVICYFSAGTYEDGRPDSAQFDRADLGSELAEWPGEYWLKTSSARVRDLMAARIKLAADIGCDAIDPDNMDGFANNNGLSLTREGAVDYVQFLAAEAGKHKMATGLKNAGGLIGDVVSDVHFSVNEECAANEECDTFHAFIDAGKPVFHIEYPDGSSEGQSNGLEEGATTSQRKTFCRSPGTGEFSTVMKTWDLDGWVQFCDGATATTEVVDGA